MYIKYKPGDLVVLNNSVYNYVIMIKSVSVLKKQYKSFDINRILTPLIITDNVEYLEHNTKLWTDIFREVSKLNN